MGNKEEEEEEELTVFHVEEGNEDSQQPGDGHLTHQLPVAMVGTERQCSFAQVSQTLNSSRGLIFVFVPLLCQALGDATHLSQSDHEEVVGVFGVVLGQLPQHGGQAGVICACNHKHPSKRHQRDTAWSGVVKAYHCPPCPWQRWSCARPRGRRRGRTC